MSAVALFVAAVLAGQSGLAEPTDKQWTECTEGLTDNRLQSCEAIAGDAKFGKEDRAYAAATIGDIYLDQRKLVEAVGEFTRALRLYPDYSYPYRRRAFAHYLQDRNDEALSDFSTAIELSPLDPYTFIARSSFYRQTERWDLARRDVEMALELDLNNPDSYYERGLLSLDVKDYDQAELDFSKILKLNPADNNARYNLTNALRNLSRSDDALTSITEYIDAVPDDPHGFRLRGWVHMDLGNFDTAEADFKTALQKAPEDGANHYALGFAHWRQNDYQIALDHYRQAERDFSSFSYFYYERGYAHYMLNQDTEAVADANRALAISPDDYDALWLKGAALMYLDDYPPALEALDQAVTLAPENSEILIMRGRVNLAAGQYFNAVGDFSLALDKNPDSIPAQTYRAYATGLAGAMPLATRTFEQILEKEPESALATELMARLLYHNEDYAAARSYSDKLVDLVPDIASHKALHGDILVELGEYSDAAESYSAAVSQVKEPPAGWLRMAAYSAHKADDPDGALRYLRLASQADRTDVWTFGMLGDLLYKRKEFENARKAYQQALDNSDDEKEKNDFRLDIAKSLAEFGSYQQALDIIDPLAKLNPGNADLAWARASVLFDLQRLEDALVEFRHYRKLKPSSLKVHYRLVEVLSAMGQHGRAIEAADTIVYMEESKAAGYQIRGKLHLAVEDFESAVLDFRRAAEDDPENVSIRLMLARALIGKGEADEALEILSSVTEPEGNRADLLFLTAKARKLLSEQEETANVPLEANETDNGDVSPQTVGLQEALR